MRVQKKPPGSEAGHIAWFMGLPKWDDVDDLELVERVAKGFPASTAEKVVHQIDPLERFVRVTDIIPKTTQHRRKGGSLTKAESERVLALAKVFVEVLRTYRDDLDRAVYFLIQKHPMLGHRSPIDLAKESIAGADLVLKVMAQADAGVAV